MITIVTVAVPDKANWVAIVKLEESEIFKTGLVFPGQQKSFTIYDNKTIKISELKDKL